MTIDSGWVHVFKEVAPRAFQSTYPLDHGSPHVAYIDGMPLLMVSESSVQSWDDLLRMNFARHVMRYFKLGCRAVVLAFDDYEHVPKAKAITQANRVKAKAEYEFGEGEQLPPCLPPKFNEKLSNRIFKRRVIDLVCNRVAQHILLNPAEKHARSFVVDYTGCPILFEAPVGASNFQGVQPQFLTHLPPMGEADVKFLRWGHYFGGRSMVAYSVDGDFIPIALMHCEAQEHASSGASTTNTTTTTPVSWEMCTGPKFDVALYRLKYNPPGSSSSGSKKKCVDKHLVATQRRLDASTGRLVHAGPPAVAAAAAASASEGSVQRSSSKKREFEYVMIPTLYRALRDRLAQTFATMSRSPEHERHYMRMVAALIGLGGTDFSRGLPYIGPMTLWNMLCTDRAVFASLLSCYDPARGVLRARAARDALATAIYMNKFATHFKKAVIVSSNTLKSSGTAMSRCISAASDDDETEDEDEEEEEEDGFAEILGTLRRSALSEKTKEGLPSAARVVATFRNVNWMLHYWSCRAPVLKPAMPSEKEKAEDEAAPCQRPRKENNDADKVDREAEHAQVSASETIEDEQKKEGERGGMVWDYGTCYPDPICKRFGFKYAQDKKKNNKKHGAKKRKTAQEAVDDGQDAEAVDEEPSHGHRSRAAAVQWYDE